MSSANINNLEEPERGVEEISLKKFRNKIGPTIDPWGTPEST